MRSSGFRGADVGSDGRGEVQREPEGGGSAEAVAGDFLAGGGGGGDGDDPVATERCAELFNEAGDGEHFTDRDGVDPDDALAGAGLAQDGGDAAEAPGQPLAVAAGAEHAQAPPGCGQGEAGREQERVNQHHHSYVHRECRPSTRFTPAANPMILIEG